MPAIATFGRPPAVVRVYHLETRNVYQVYWRTAEGAHIKQRTVKQDALDLGKDVAQKLRRAAPGQIVASVSAVDRQLLALANQLENPTAQISALVDQQRRDAIDVTLAELCDSRARELKTAPKETRKGSLSRLNSIRSGLGQIYLNSLTEPAIRDWLDSMDVAPRTKNNRLAELRTMINAATQRQLAPKGFNPACDVPKVREKKSEPSTWDASQLRAIFATLLQKDRSDLIPFVALGAFGGLRPTEIAGVPGERDGIHWTDINFDERYIRVRAEVAGKLSEPRYIQFTHRESGLTEAQAEACWQTLRSWLDIGRQLSGPVAYRKSQTMTSAILREAGIIDQWPADVLRHSFISYFLALTNNRAHVAEMAGNSPRIIASNYRAPVLLASANDWFSVRPDRAPPENVIKMSA